MHKIICSLLFVCLINCCTYTDLQKDIQVSYKIYSFHDSDGMFILKIPMELPLNKEHLDSIFLLHCPKENDILISKNTSGLKLGGVKYTYHGSPKKNPLKLHEEFINKKKYFRYNSVVLSTMSYNLFFNKYNPNSKLLLKSTTILDNYEMSYHINANIVVPYDSIFNTYKYATLLNKIEIFKVEN